jgi:hypothetical protein
MATPAHFSNLAMARPVKRTAGALKAAANVERDREAILKTKIDRIHQLLNRLEARAIACDLEVKRQQARKKAACARAEAIEDRVLREMQDAGLKELAGRSVTLIAREAGVSKLIVTDASLIPAIYMRVSKPPAPAPDAMQIKAALERGEDVAGVRLVRTVSLLRK